MSIEPRVDTISLTVEITFSTRSVILKIVWKIASNTHSTESIISNAAFFKPFIASSITPNKLSIKTPSK